MSNSVEQRQNLQSAPYPDALEDLIDDITYKSGWTFDLRRVQRDFVDGDVVGVGLTLCIHITCQDSYHPDRATAVMHYFPVPPATYDMRSWRRWLFEQVLLVERHEAMEFFQIDGERPFGPSHGPGNDPYMIREVGTVTDQKMSFRGVLNS